MGCPPGGDQPQHVAQIVSRIRQQCDRTADQTIAALDQDEDHVQRRADGERPDESVGDVVMVVMAVAVMVTMGMPVPVTMVMTMGMLVGMIVRHDRTTTLGGRLCQPGPVSLHARN